MRNQKKLAFFRMSGEIKKENKNLLTIMTKLSDDTFFTLSEEAKSWYCIS